MSEYLREPIRGLPGLLPPGERILWQGSPDARVLARTALHTRMVAGYFALLAGWGLAVPLSQGIAGIGDLSPTAITIALGAVVIALLQLLAHAVARGAVYTLTDRRLVLRIGVAVPKCVNLPLAEIASADLALRRDGTGDIALALRGVPKLGYLMLWPHARAWRIARPVPMLRAVPEAATVAALVARTCLAANPAGRIEAVVEPAGAMPDYGTAVAA